MYNNDIRVANTATQMIQTQTNVGNFGWTGADQGHYNQLIQYVEEVRSVWAAIQDTLDVIQRVGEESDKINEAIEYVYKSSNEMRDLHSQMESLLTRAENYLGQMRVVEESVKFIQKDMTPKYEDFLVKYEDFLNKLP